MMKTFASLSLALVTAAIVGCSTSTAETIYIPAAQQGVVDKSLPSELRDRQQSLFRLLRGLQDGIDETVALRSLVPGVNFRESFEKFYDGTKRLVRWEFNGPPKGNEVPVVLYFDDQEHGPVDPQKLQRVERTYIVAGSGQQFTVTRK